MLVPHLTSLDGTLSLPLFQIGPTGSWGDLSYTTRWGEGACGMFEASWTMSLPPRFEHSLLRRGTLVELMDGSYRVGSSLVMSEPGRGAGFELPWTITCTGIGRDVEGENSFYAEDSGGDPTTVPSTAVDQAIADGWRVAGRLASVPTGATGGSSTSDELRTVGSLLTAASDPLSQRWGVDSDNYVFFAADPSIPKYLVTPEAAALGTTDTDYASVVKVRYDDSSSGVYETKTATNAQTDQRFGRKVYMANLIELGPISAALAQDYADGILAKLKGRLGWTTGLTLTSSEIATRDGGPTDLSKVAEDVGNGCMLRMQGIFDDLLEFSGVINLDIIIGEAKLTDEAQTIDLNPLGMAPRVFAAVVESVTGMAAA